MIYNPYNNPVTKILGVYGTGHVANKLTKKKGHPANKLTKKKERKMGFVPNFDQVSSAVGISKCKININKPVRGIVRASHIDYYDQFVVSGTISGGLAYWKQLCCLGTTSQWSTSTAFQANFAELSQTKWLDLDPNRANTGSTRIPILAAQKTSRFALPYANVHIDFYNPTSSLMQYEVFVCVAKQWTSTDPLLAISNGYLAQAGGVAAQTIPASGAGVGAEGSVLFSRTAGTTANTTEAYSEAYITVGGAKLMKADWKIECVKSFTLAGNSQHRFTASCKLNQFGDQELLLNQNATYPKGSVYMFAKVLGGLGKDGAAAGTLTYVPPSLQAIVNRQYKFKQMLQPQKMAVSLASLGVSTGSTNGAITTLNAALTAAQTIAAGF